MAFDLSVWLYIIYKICILKTTSEFLVLTFFLLLFIAHYTTALFNTLTAVTPEGSYLRSC